MSTHITSMTKGTCSFLQVCVWLVFVVFLCLCCCVMLSAPKGGRYSARLSGKSLLEQRLSMAKASSSARGPSKAVSPVGVINLDSPPSKAPDVKRKAATTLSALSGILKERSVEDFLGFGYVEAKKEIGDLHPIDCMNEAVVGVWKIFQYSLVASTIVQELSDRVDKKMMRLEEQLKTAEERMRALDRELSLAKKDFETRLDGMKAEMQDKAERLHEDDARTTGDVGAYYCLKSRIEMMEELAVGSHVEWKIDDARADMELLYPDGNPRDELFKLVGLGIENDKEEVD